MSTSTSLSKTGLNDDNVIFAPNESEVERLDKQHKVVYAAMPQLVLAPVDLASGGKRVLDQATGIGIWLRDVRQAAGVNSNMWVGTDIEDSYFPTENPADTSYYHQSMTEPWPKSWHGTFDLVHSRMALPGVGHNPLGEAVKNLVGLVKPGGWIQLVEMEWQNWEGGPVLDEFQAALKQLFGMITNGQGVDMRERLATQLEEAGLVEVQSKIVKVPVGAKAKDEVRELSLQSMFATASFATATLQKVAPDLVDDKLKTMPDRLREELQSAGGGYNVFALWAQKPAQS